MWVSVRLYYVHHVGVSEGCITYIMWVSVRVVLFHIFFHRIILLLLNFSHKRNFIRFIKMRSCLRNNISQSLTPMNFFQNVSSIDTHEPPSECLKHWHPWTSFRMSQTLTPMNFFQNVSIIDTHEPPSECLKHWHPWTSPSECLKHWHPWTSFRMSQALTPMNFFQNVSIIDTHEPPSECLKHWHPWTSPSECLKHWHPWTSFRMFHHDSSKQPVWFCLNVLVFFCYTIVTVM